MVNMLKFEMDITSYAITTVPATGNNNTSLDIITLNKSHIGFISNIKFYNKFIIGAYGIETNTTVTYPTPQVTYLQSSTSDCKSNTDFTNTLWGTARCQYDYEESFDVNEICM